MVRKNELKRKLRAGEKVIGVFMPPPSPLLVEVSAAAGFDFVLLDNEHGPIGPETAYHMILAAEATGITPLIRVGLRDKQEVLKFLDLGIQGIMSPQVNTAEDAEYAVASSRYIPRGIRGLAGGRAFNFGVGIAPSDAAQQINEEMLSLIQFEHIDALPELEKIVQVPDLDVLFVGPNDLAQSMGKPGLPGDPEVTKIADEAVATAKSAGVKTGTTAFSVEAAKAALDRGFDMVVANAPGLYL
ncbi:MAG TPA: aldolase/citrate lyase family protein, partial [Thermomicrobiales bacterium]|nr:aldolase/citrate lyase family protein [Thermomicrobiales bacterium]